MKSTIKLLVNHKGLTLLSLLLTIIIAISSVASSITLAPLTDALIAGKERTVIYWLILTAIFWGIFLSINYLNTVLQAYISRKIANEIRTAITTGLNGVSISEYQKVDHNEYVSWLTNDVNLIENNGIAKLFDLVNSGIILILSAGALFIYHYSLALAAIILAALTMLIPHLFNHFMAHETTRISKANSLLLKQVEDIIAGFSVFFAHNIGSKLTQKIKDASDKQGKQQVIYTKKTGLVELLMGALSVTAQLAITGLTCFLALSGYFSVGVISSSGQLAGIVFSRLSTVINDLFKMQSVSPLLTKDIQSKQSDITDIPTKNFNSALTIDHLSYAYATDKPVIRDLTYRFEKGGKYAIVGKSGVGKSTLINLISGRLKGYQGTIKIDNQELESLDSANINAKVELVEQKPYIFNETVKENITLGIQQTEVPFNAALKFLKVDKFTTPETQLSEHGQNLSGGQRQKIALARAMIFDKPILIIDEVTAGIDTESSQQIEDTLLADKTKTVIMITHNLTEKTRKNLTGIVEL